MTRTWLRDFILPLAFGVILNACAAPQRPRLYTTYAGYRGDQNPPIVSVFTTSETVMICVSIPYIGAGTGIIIGSPSWKVFREEVLANVNIVDISTGNIVAHKSSVMKHANRYWLSFNIPSGSYRAFLIANNIRMAETSFRVIGDITALRTGRGLIVTRLQDVKEGQLPSAKDTFGPGETPTFYIHGYGGETVTLVILDLTTGVEKETRTAYAAEGKDVYWHIDLGSGTYRAEVHVSGVTMHSAIFVIRK